MGWGERGQPSSSSTAPVGQRPAQFSGPDLSQCWGDNSSGQLGLGDTNNRGDHPNELDDALPAIDLATSAKAVSVEVETKSLSQLVSDAGSSGLEGIPTLGHKVVTS